MANESRNEAIRTFALFGRTRDILGDYLTQSRLTDPARQFLAEDALTFLDRVREGYRWHLRAPELTVEELRRVVQAHDLPVYDPYEPARDSHLLVPSRQILIATNLAQVVLGWVPQLPAEAITYPGWARRTYADIMAPRSPSEFFDRVDDLERLIWSITTGLREAATSSLRRAYAFFESGFWLTQQFRPRGTR